MACFLPTLVNGVNNVHLVSEIESKDSDSISNLINNVRETINVHNKKSNNHTNIILMNVPFWYDLSNSTFVSKNISTLNRKLQKLVKVFPHTSFLITDNRNLFTNHGLHPNKLGKQLVYHHIASLLQSIF
jgi:hypothetical protein